MRRCPAPPASRTPVPFSSRTPAPPASRTPASPASRSQAAPRRRPSAPLRALLAVLVALPLLLAGCTSSSDQADTTSGAANDAGVDAGGGGEALAPGEAAPGPAAPDEPAAPAEGDPTAAPLSVTQGRAAPGASLIRTGELSVLVTDVGDAADRAGRVASSAGGTVEAEERSAGGPDGTASGSAVVVLRVPPAQFDGVLRQLAELGEELDRRIGTQDVTDQVVDLDSRIATQRASVARVRSLLEEADDLGDVVQIEGELTRRTADLESLEARLAALEEQVDLSTITLRLEDGDGPAAAGTPRGFTDGVQAGWRALTALALATSLTVGALLPFAPLLLLVAALVWRSRSRRAAT